MSNLSKLDKAIAILQYNLTRRKKKVKEITQKLEMTENEKVKVGFETELISNVEVLIDEYKQDVKRHLGKLPPQALDLEEAVLGAIMLESDAIEKVMKYLLPVHFYSESHKIIYEACLKVHEQFHPVDMRTVVAQLRKTGDIESIGGAHRIAEITSKVSQAANIEHHARIMMEHAIKREIIKLIGIGQWAYEDTRDCFELLGEVEDHIKKINSWIK